MAAAATLVIVQHPVDGRAEEGQRICAAIRAKLAGVSADELVFFHDATKMKIASPAYAKVFKELDAELGERKLQMVCAIPGAIPRLMAQTVSIASSRHWHIFKSREEAVEYLRGTGFTRDLPEMTGAGVKVL